MEISDITEIEEHQRFADDSDRASSLEMQFNAEYADKAITAARKSNAPQTHPDFDGEHCLDCDTKIPEERLAMGRIRCVECQTLIEKHSNRYH